MQICKYDNMQICNLQIIYNIIICDYTMCDYANVICKQAVAVSLWWGGQVL